MCHCISNQRHLLHRQHDLRPCVFSQPCRFSFPDEKSRLFSRSKPINRQLIVFQANKDSTSICSPPRGCFYTHAINKDHRKKHAKNESIFSFHVFTSHSHSVIHPAFIVSENTHTFSWLIS